MWHHASAPCLCSWLLGQAEDTESLIKEEPRGVEFSGEEGLGRFLDLHEHHMSFVSAHKTFGRKIDYYEYVACFAADMAPGGAIARAHKGSRQYRQYIEALHAYLVSFYERSQPLGQLLKQLVKV